MRGMACALYAFVVSFSPRAFFFAMVGLLSPTDPATVFARYLPRRPLPRREPNVALPTAACPFVAFDLLTLSEEDYRQRPLRSGGRRSVVECRLECHCCGALRLALSLAPNGWSLRQERSRRAASSRDARKEAERRFGLTTARTSPTTYITALWPAFAGSGRWGCWLGDDRSHDCDLPRLRRRTHRQTARRSQTHRIRERFAVRILFAGFRVWRTRARRLARD